MSRLYKAKYCFTPLCWVYITLRGLWECVVYRNLLRISIKMLESKNLPLRLRCAKLYLFPIMAIILVVVVVLYLPIFHEVFRCKKCYSCAENTEFQKNLARKLNNIHGQLVELASSKNPKLLLEFEEILQLFDNEPRNRSSIDDHRRERDVCPETFKGTMAGFPYYEKGWVLTNCSNAKPIKSVISILINAVFYNTQDVERLSYVLDGITESYPTVDVLLAIQDKQTIKNIEKYGNLKVFKHSSSSGQVLGQIWNMLIKKAKTPYVLVARDVVHFSWLSQLERLIRVVSEIPNVGVAGGSYRNLSGHWKMGCFQSTMKNYVLEYQEGYLHSKNECMLCDYLQGPFVAKKSILHFDETINNEVVFEDMFVSLTRKGTLIMGCPDAMFFRKGAVINSKESEKKAWKEFAKKWTLNRVRLSNGVSHSFSCEDIQFECDTKISRSYLLPVCCQEKYEYAMSVLQDFANQHDFSFELDTGSALGTVKFNGLMPWDIDGDVRVLSKKIDIFNKKETKEYFNKHGLRLTGYEQPSFKVTDSYDGYANIANSGIGIEVWGRPLLTCPQFLPKDLQKNFTLTLVRRKWVKTVFSPGLFVRNRYGEDILKHSQSWRMRGLKHSYSQYKARSFRSCENPQHHSCLNHFPADGDIPFLVA